MTLNLLTAAEMAFIKQDVKDILEDHTYNTDIIYRRSGGKAFNPSTGAVAPTYVDTTIRAFKGNHTARDIGESGGLLKVGDLFFMFDPSLINKPTSEDILLEEVTDVGRVKATSGSAVIVGYETEFLKRGVQGGDMMEVEVVFGTLQNGRVKSVQSDEGLTLTANWVTSVVAGEFKVYRVYSILNHIIDPLEAAIRVSARRAGA